MPIFIQTYQQLVKETPPASETNTHRAKMADKFTAGTRYKHGSCTIHEWMQRYLSLASSKEGPVITCKTLAGDVVRRGLNCVGILFEDCRFMRQGTDVNHGSGGSNSVTGRPVAFVDLETVFPAVFESSKDGILALTKGNCFVTPLCQVGDKKYHDTSMMMKEGYTEFVAQRKGNVQQEVSHIANGISCAAAAILFHLSQEITLNGSRPDKERLTFLVEALYVIALTARSVAEYSPSCKEIFELLAVVAKTADVFQSVFMAFVFDKTPNIIIRKTMVESVIFRNFKHEAFNVDYIEKLPVGLVGLLLIAPMIGGLLTTDIETTELINIIARSINEAIDNVAKKIANTDYELLEKKSKNPCDGAIHLRNKDILRCFASASKVPFIDPGIIDLIYDNVVTGRKDNTVIPGIRMDADFAVRNNPLTINTRTVLKNSPVLMNHYAPGTGQGTGLDGEFLEAADYIASDPHEWCGLHLKPGEYELSAKALGMSTFKKGSTRGEKFVANFRITAGNEVLGGLFEGYAASGMFYDPKTKRFREDANLMHLDPNGIFKIVCNYEAITVMQNDTCVLTISNRGDTTLCPLIAFKYCTIHIKYVKEANLLKPMTPAKSSLVAPGISYSAMAQGNQTGVQNESKNDEIEKVKTLSDVMQAMRVTSIRKTTASQQVFGQKTAQRLQNQ